jgi:hypothetical protein
MTEPPAKILLHGVVRRRQLSSRDSSRGACELNTLAIEKYRL